MQSDRFTYNGPYLQYAVANGTSCPANASVSQQAWAAVRLDGVLGAECRMPLSNAAVAASAVLTLIGKDFSVPRTSSPNSNAFQSCRSGSCGSRCVLRVSSERDAIVEIDGQSQQSQP
eukprot:3109000-Rhodomonas_salina.1